MKQEKVGSCYASAMRLLAYADRSEKQLREQLERRGYGKEEINDAIELLKEKKYLSDPRFMEQCARYLANRKLYGRGRIRIELILKFGRESYALNYPQIESSLEDSVNYHENALTLARKHFARGRDYIFAKLKNNGFSSDEIKYALTCLDEQDSEP